METIVGVRFKQAGKIYYFDPGKHELELHDHVIVKPPAALNSAALSLLLGRWKTIKWCSR